MGSFFIIIDNLIIIDFTLKLVPDFSQKFGINTLFIKSDKPKIHDVLFKRYIFFQIVLVISQIFDLV